MRPKLLLILDVEIGNLGRNRRPSLVANGGVDAPQHLMRSYADISQEHIIRIEDHGDWAGSQRD